VARHRKDCQRCTCQQLGDRAGKVGHACASLFRFAWVVYQEVDYEFADSAAFRKSLIRSRPA
jgi:hypothetical protein